VPTTFDRTEYTVYCKLFDIIVVCWQTWKDVREEAALAVNKGSHDVGLRKQHLGCHNSWDCWYCILLVLFWVLHCIGVGSAYWRLVETCCYIMWHH